MPKAICRCGQPLPIPADGSDRVVCPGCGARVRLRVKSPGSEGDGYIRFNCACGRRLKVPADRADGSEAQCPECGQAVRIPERGSLTGSAAVRPGGGTDDFTPEQLEGLRKWSEGWSGRPRGEPRDAATGQSPRAEGRAEAGFRVCPKCKTPVHLGADTCRSCGTVVPRR